MYSADETASHKILAKIIRVKPAGDETATPASSQPQKKGKKDGLSVNVKLLVLAFAIEGGVIATSIIGHGIFALSFGQDSKTRMMMLLGPAVTAIVELARVPLAMMAGSHPSFGKRTVAIVAVVCLTPARSGAQQSSA